MKKLVISIATTLMAAAVLVACNGATGSDITSPGSADVAKAVCTSSNNWQSVGIGMSPEQVQARLGAPAKITSAVTSTLYEYERCRAGNFLVKEGTDATATEPAKPDEYSTFYFGGSVEISSSRGVVKVTSPILDSDKPMACEWDLYNYPNNYSSGTFICRRVDNPF